MKKNEKDKTKINDENIQKIKQELADKHKFSDTTKGEMNRKIQINILIAITVILYFWLLNIGFTSSEEYSFFRNLKIFSIIILFGAIILFEIAYKKDEGRYCIFGIEALVLATSTLFLTYVVVFLSDKLTSILAICAFVFAIYYTMKSLGIYIKTKREFNKNKSDVKYIVKK